jgi:hypothetical protein
MQEVALQGPDLAMCKQPSEIQLRDFGERVRGVGRILDAACDGYFNGMTYRGIGAGSDALREGGSQGWAG